MDEFSDRVFCDDQPSRRRWIGIEQRAASSASHPALAEALAPRIEGGGRPDGGEIAPPEVLRRVDPLGWRDGEPLEDRGHLLGDRAAFVGSHDPPGPIDELQVIAQPERQGGLARG